MTIGSGSFLNELVERAGGSNLFEDLSATAGPISIEAVAARDPDLILTTTAGPAAFARRPEWQVVRAVRERRFLPVTGSAFDRPSPRAPAAIRELTRKLREAA
jgi:iron complex transport system substrate-binding protein